MVVINKSELTLENEMVKDSLVNKKNQLGNLRTEEKLDEIVTSLKEIYLIELPSLIKKIELEFNLTVEPFKSNAENSTEKIFLSKFSKINDQEVTKDSTLILTLTEAPSEKKIGLLKIVRNITGLGLKESKDIVDKVPTVLPLKETITIEQANDIQKMILDAGGKLLVTKT